MTNPWLDWTAGAVLGVLGPTTMGVIWGPSPNFRSPSVAGGGGTTSLSIWTGVYLGARAPRLRGRSLGHHTEQRSVARVNAPMPWRLKQEAWLTEYE